jgi:hypothetical protein
MFRCETAHFKPDEPRINMDEMGVKLQLVAWTHSNLEVEGLGGVGVPGIRLSHRETGQRQINQFEFPFNAVLVYLYRRDEFQAGKSSAFLCRNEIFAHDVLPAPVCSIDSIIPVLFPPCESFTGGAASGALGRIHFKWIVISTAITLSLLGTKQHPGMT